MIKTERCKLEKLKREDFSDIQMLYVDEKVRRYLGGIVNESLFKDRFMGMLEPKDKTIYWVARSRETDKFIGLVSLDPHHDDTETEISYQIMPGWWGIGIGAEVVGAVLNYGFGTMKLSRVIAETQMKNSASCKLLEKLGMQEEKRVERFGEMQIIYGKRRMNKVRK